MNEIAELETKASSLVLTAKTLVVTDDLTLGAAGEFLVAVKTLGNQIKDTFKDPKDKAWAAHKAITAAEKKHLDPVLEAEAIAKDKIGAYTRERDAIERKKQEDAKLAMAEKLEMAGASDMAEQVLNSEVVVQKSKVAGVSTKVVYKHRVVDASKVPDKYWLLNESMVAAVVRAEGKAANIPGIEVYEDIQVSARSFR